MSKMVNCNFFFPKMYNCLEKDKDSCLTHQGTAAILTQQEGINIPLLRIKESYCWSKG